MKKTIREFGLNVLSKEEMRATKGGDMYYCQCNGTAGGWYGNYNSPSQAGGAVNSACGNGGGCRQL